MKKYFLFILIVSLSLNLIAQQKDIPPKIAQKGFTKIDFLSINMPEAEIPNEPNMGFSGIHYNIFLNKDIYAGIGIYGSVTGKRGGFFTLGVNAGYKKFLTKKLYIDTGFHFGGGGGAGAQDGGGAFILPHFNLGYDFKYFSVNTGYSYVNFFDDGLIKGNQLNFGLEIPLNYEYAHYKESEKRFSFKHLKTSNWNQKSKTNSLMIHLNNLDVTRALPNREQIIEGKTIRLAGFEFANYFTENWFAFVKVDGAYDGIRAGFMDVFLGGGYHYSFNRNRTNILGKFSLGAAGGGGVDSDGGFMISPDISIEQKIFDNTFIAINKGYILTPSQVFSSSSYGIGLKYYANRNGTNSDKKTFKSGIFKGVDFIVKHDWYFDAKRMENPTEDMHQIALQINLDLNKYLYVAGQTAFANFGNAGAYGEGLIGLGVKSKDIIAINTRFFGQFLAGAAGGGNISTGEGFIIKPSVGAEYKINKKIRLRSSVGYVKAKGGSLSNTFVNLGINYNFSFLNMK
ncbi:hypothetical protein [uncultured Polaribacter sp.]|uniref:hypothetical protein n=1 Tax=uncultured Polaribacter sp. TaxID=174711 RepID=UPI00261CAAF8|nr:hypothetical protein [uncultured Polaribacter sp.]